MIGAFLDHLEVERDNSIRTRNARLAAIHSLFRYAALRHPEDAAVIGRVLAMPPKLFDTTVVTYFTEDEIEALLAATDQQTWTGRRDKTMLALACQTGLRASELTALTVSDIHLGSRSPRQLPRQGPPTANHTPRGQHRATAPSLDHRTRRVEHRPTVPHTARNPTQPRRSATPHRQIRRPRRRLLSDTGRKAASPHVMRHSAAMRLLNAGVDIVTVALWLGHQNVATTNIYVHSDLALKERALARTAPKNLPPGRYKPSDKLLAFLEAL